jgi:hypothetical protein
MSGTGNEPKIRARINHSRTQKDGWRAMVYFPVIGGYHHEGNPGINTCAG